MRVIVVGAGIIGVTTAYYLNRAGCTVTVLERNTGVAQECSHGNAGIVAPGYATPWAQPGMPGKILSYLFRQDAPVLLRPQLDPAFWRWIVRWLRECDLERYQRNKERMQRIALYSRAQLHELREAHQLAYEQTEGYLQLLRSARDVELVEPALSLLRAAGIAHQKLDATQCRLREPGLGPLDFAGGIYLPGDEAGNCPLFARQVKDLAQRAGVHYEFGAAVRTIARDGAELLVSGSREYRTDAVVIAAGVGSCALTAALGLRIPMYPVKGYSATVAIKEPVHAPRASVMDEAYKVAMTRLGNRLRVAGTAEIGSHKLALRDSALRTLVRVARDWFPGAADFGGAQYWVGARPMLPDGAPLLGLSGVAGVYLNLGHGSIGWSMACGSGRIVADLICGQKPEIDLEGLTIERYARQPKPH